MQRPNLLYLITASTALLGLAACAYLLVWTGQPSADVLADHYETHPWINAADFEPGDAEILRIQGKNIVVWRRNAADIALAKAQNDPTQWPNKYFNVTGRAGKQIADDANLTLNHEWFFAWGQPRGRFSCAVLLRTGDFGGFFDPCRGAHFDLSGWFQPNDHRRSIFRRW